MKVEKKFYYCGVYNGELDDEYPWYFAFEGQFISKNGRHCKFPKAAEFMTKQTAIEFFDSWVNKNKQRKVYKLHVVSELKWVEDPSVKKYPENHPMYAVDSSDVKSMYKNTARSYFWAIPFYQSKATLKKHREILLKEFGFDISLSLSEELKLKRIDRHYIEAVNKPSSLKLV
ncbi:MAG: hypothetical protein V5786_04235 [Psychromonas sp.]